VTNEQDPLVERLLAAKERLLARRTGQLRATISYGNPGHCDPCLEPAAEACAEAAATITRLTAERDALRGALEWVAQYTHELEVKRKVRNTLKEISNAE
jgi:hypothetical protein